MSGKLTGMVFDRYPKGGGEMLLALKLADNAHDDGTRIFPSVDTMAQKTHQARRTVQYQLDRMRESCWLLLVKPARGGRGSAGYAAEYRINPEWIKGAEFASLKKLSTASLAELEKGANFAPIKQEKGATESVKGCKPKHKRVQVATEKGATAIAPQPSVNHHEPPLNPANDEGGEKPEAENLINPSPFDRWWNTFPSHAGRRSGRGACAKEWVVQDLDLQVELLVIHTEAMKLTKKWREGYYPGPIRYLTEHGWKDGSPEPKPVLQEETQTGDWFESDSGIAKRGGALNVQREKDEPTPKYLLRVAKAAGRGAHIDYVLREAKRTGSSDWYRYVVQCLGEALMPTDFYAS